MISNIIQYDHNTTINLLNFDEIVWKRFLKVLQIQKYSKIYLDFRFVDFISPPILPRLCCMGIMALKKGVELEILINGVSNLKSYLAEMDFFDIVKKYNILTVDEGTTGGMIEKNEKNRIFLCFDKKDILDKYNKLYTPKGDYSEKDILKSYVRMEVMGESYQGGNLEENIIKKSKVLSVLQNISKDYKVITNIALEYVELIHNAIWHGKSLCFFVLQAGKYEGKYNEKFSRVEVSIMDAGERLYKTLIDKDWTQDRKTTKTISLSRFYNLKSVQAQDFYSVIEMILYRKDEKIRGIYDVMESLLEKPSLRVDYTNNIAKMSLNKVGLKKVMDENLQLKDYVDWMDIGMGFGIDIAFNL